MTAIQRKKIKEIEVINNGNDIVTSVVIEWLTYDDSDPEEIREIVDKRFTLDTDEIDLSSSGFIPYNDLTPETIFNWLEKRLNSVRIKEMEQRLITSINNRVNPPEPDPPATITKELPWNSK